MARKRQIDPVYPFEKEIRSLSIPARYFYILSWCHTDDQNGVLPYDTFHLKNQIFPEEIIDIEPIIQELIAQGRYYAYQAEGKNWLWCPTLKKHQNIQHPTKRSYPPPPKELIEKYNNRLNEDSMRTHIPLTQSRVELSRVESKQQKKLALWAAFSEDTNKLLTTVYNNKLNIYALLTKFHKERPAYEIPEEVVVGVCNSFLANKDKIKSDWPWFLKALAEELTKHRVKAQDQEHEKLKNQGWALSIADIMAMVGKRGLTPKER